jgi:hypothetical protein
MDFTGEYLDYVISVDERYTTENGESNVIIQHITHEAAQQWTYDPITKSIRSLES